MIRAVEAFLRSWSAGPLSRRALDETFADWRHELTDGVRRRPAMLVHARGLTAVCSVLAHSAWTEIGSRDSWRLAAWVVLLAGICSLANVSITDAGLVAPVVMPATFPLFVLLFSAGVPARPDARPWLGAAAILGAVLFVCSGWLAPMLQHALNERYAAMGVHLEPNLRESPLPAVARVAMNAGWDAGLAVIRINSIVTMALLAPIFMWLGLQGRAFARAVARPRLGQSLALGCGVSVFFLAEQLMRLAVPLGDTSTFARAAVQVVTFWSHIAFALAEGAFLIWLAQARTGAPPDGWAEMTTD